MGTVSIVYLGPDPYGVVIADTGQFAHTGHPVPVDSELAERLLEQEGTFAKAGTKAAKEAASKAAPAEEPDVTTTPNNEER